MRAFFFYGTLIDEAVLAAVIGRKPPPSRPATLTGFRRVYRAGATFPVLKPADAAACIEGRLVERLTPADVRRLREFEGADYAVRTHTVVAAAGDRVSAEVFVPKPAVPATDTEWSFEDWYRRHRPAYLRRIKGVRSTPA